MLYFQLYCPPLDQSVIFANVEEDSYEFSVVDFLERVLFYFSVCNVCKIFSVEILVFRFLKPRPQRFTSTNLSHPIYIQVLTFRTIRIVLTKIQRAGFSYWVNYILRTSVFVLLVEKTAALEPYYEVV